LQIILGEKEDEKRTMHQRSWLAVKPTHKGSPPPATPPMRGRSLSSRKNQIKIE